TCLAGLAQHEPVGSITGEVMSDERRRAQRDDVRSVAGRPDTSGPSLTLYECAVGPPLLQSNGGRDPGSGLFESSKRGPSRMGLASSTPRRAPISEWASTLPLGLRAVSTSVATPRAVASPARCRSRVRRCLSLRNPVTRRAPATRAAHYGALALLGVGATAREQERVVTRRDHAREELAQLARAGLVDREPAERAPHLVGARRERAGDIRLREAVCSESFDQVAARHRRAGTTAHGPAHARERVLLVDDQVARAVAVDGLALRLDLRAPRFAGRVLGRELLDRELVHHGLGLLLAPPRRLLGASTAER